jgi:hypothetical protein
VKLFVKGNEKLTFAIAIGVLSTLALSITLSPTFNLLVKAQSKTGMSEGVQQQLLELAGKVRELGSKSGLNVTLPQGGNLTEKLQTLADSPQFKNLTEQIKQQLVQLGLNGSEIQSLKQQADSDLGGLVQKLQNLTSSRGA